MSPQRVQEEVHAGEMPRGKRSFKALGCSLKHFRDLRESQDRWADHCNERRSLWFPFTLWNAPEWPGCYAIYIDGGLVYIGQTENVKARFSTHRSTGILKGVDFDRVVLKVKLPRRFGEWAMTEIRLIKYLKPLLNRAKIASKEHFPL